MDEQQQQSLPRKGSAERCTIVAVGKFFDARDYSLVDFESAYWCVELSHPNDARFFLSLQLTNEATKQIIGTDGSTLHTSEVLYELTTGKS